MRIGIECSREAIAINCQLSEKPMTVTVDLKKQPASNRRRYSFRSSITSRTISLIVNRRAFGRPAHPRQACAELLASLRCHPR